MTPTERRAALVGAMALACCDNHLGNGFWARTNEPERNYWRAQAVAALDALLAALPDLGLKLVPKVATDAIVTAALDRPFETPGAGDVDLYRSIYTAMLAAAPNPMEDGE